MSKSDYKDRSHLEAMRKAAVLISEVFDAEDVQRDEGTQCSRAAEILLGKTCDKVRVLMQEVLDEGLEARVAPHLAVGTLITAILKETSVVLSPKHMALLFAQLLGEDSALDNVYEYREGDYISAYIKVKLVGDLAEEVEAAAAEEEKEKEKEKEDKFAPDGMFCVVYVPDEGEINDAGLYADLLQIKTEGGGDTPCVMLFTNGFTINKEDVLITENLVARKRCFRVKGEKEFFHIKNNFDDFLQANLNLIPSEIAMKIS